MRLYDSQPLCYLCVLALTGIAGHVLVTAGEGMGATSTGGLVAITSGGSLSGTGGAISITSGTGAVASGAIAMSTAPMSAAGAGVAGSIIVSTGTTLSGSTGRIGFTVGDSLSTGTCFRPLHFLSWQKKSALTLQVDALVLTGLRHGCSASVQAPRAVSPSQWAPVQQSAVLSWT
jgi:hypothetical protein